MIIVSDQDFCCGMKTPQDVRVILPSANRHPIRKGEFKGVPNKVSRILTLIGLSEEILKSHVFPGPLLVNVSVLLLSLASPDESSLVKLSSLLLSISG